VGTGRTPLWTGDPLEKHFAELQAFEGLLSVFETLSSSLLIASRAFAKAHRPLQEHLDSDAPGGSRHHPGVAALGNHLSEMLSSFAVGLQDAESQLEEMMQLVEQARGQLAPVREAFAEREVCWDKKVQCARDVEEMRERIAWKSRNYTNDEKKTRLAASHTAEEALQSATERAERLMGDIRELQVASPGAMLTRLSGFHNKAVVPSQKLARNIGNLLASLPTSDKLAIVHEVPDGAPLPDCWNVPAVLRILMLGTCQQTGFA